MAGRQIHNGQIDMDRLFAALGDPTRRDLLGKLALGPKTVSQLAEELRVTKAAVLQHLAWLEEVSLVNTEKIGRTRVCSTDPAGFNALEEWVRNHRTVWEMRLDRLGEVLEGKDEGRGTKLQRQGPGSV